MNLRLIRLTNIRYVYILSWKLSTTTSTTSARVKSTTVYYPLNRNFITSVSSATRLLRLWCLRGGCVCAILLDQLAIGRTYIRIWQPEKLMGRERGSIATSEPTRSYASITWGFSSSSYPSCSIRGPFTDQKALLPASWENQWLKVMLARHRC